MRLFPLLLVLGLAVSSPAQSPHHYSIGQADTVMQELHEAIVTYHPAAFRGDTRERLDTALAGVRERLAQRVPTDSLTMAAVIATGVPFRDVLGDGHFQLRPVQTKAFRKARDSSQYTLPLTRDSRNMLYLRDSVTLRDSTVLPKGALVTHVDGHEVQALIAEVSAIGGVDDHALPYAREFYAAHYLPEFYQRVYGYRDSLRLGYVAEAQAGEVWLYPDTVEVKEKRLGYLMRVATRGKRRRARLAESIYLDTTAVPGVYHLRVRSFSNGVLGGANPYRRLRRLFRELGEANASGLIVDVRGNTGGTADLVDHLYGFLATERYTMLDSMTASTTRAVGKNPVARMGNRVFAGTRGRDSKYRRMWAGKPVKPKRRHHFGGDVVVLTNELTFSGGSTLAPPACARGGRSRGRW